MDLYDGWNPEPHAPDGMRVGYWCICGEGFQFGHLLATHIAQRPAVALVDTGDEMRELIDEVRELFNDGWCICTRSGLGDRVLAALEKWSKQ